jgi:hypothetical protein
MPLRLSHLIAALLSAAALFHSGCATSDLATSDLSTRIVFPQASLNGQPVRAVLDTGSSQSVQLTTQEARRLGLRFTPTPNPAATAPFVGLTAPAELTLGAVNVTAQMTTFSLPGSNAGLLVGWPAVKDNMLLFMGALHTVAIVTMDDVQVPDTTGWLKVKTSSTTTGVLILEMPFPDGTTGNVMVDTGDPYGAALPTARWVEWCGSHHLAFLPITVHMQGPAGASEDLETQADNFSLGALTLTNVPLRSLDDDEAKAIAARYGHLDGVLGLGALRRMDLVVDGKHGVAYLHPLPPAGAGVAGSANPSPVPADQNQDWTVVRQTGLSRAAFILTSVQYKVLTQNNAGAIADCTRALELEPLAVDAWVLRAAARLNQKDDDGALADFSHALELDPQKRRGLLRARFHQGAQRRPRWSHRRLLSRLGARSPKHRGLQRACFGRSAERRLHWGPAGLQSCP